VSTTEELLVRNSSGSGLENREYGRATPSIRKRLALTSPTCGGRSVCTLADLDHGVCSLLILKVILKDNGEGEGSIQVR
jgi:hypothetical protein